MTFEKITSKHGLGILLLASTIWLCALTYFRMSMYQYDEYGAILLILTGIIYYIFTSKPSRDLIVGALFKKDLATLALSLKTNFTEQLGKGTKFYDGAPEKIQKEIDKIDKYFYADLTLFTLSILSFYIVLFTVVNQSFFIEFQRMLIFIGWGIILILIAYISYKEIKIRFEHLRSIERE